MLIIIIEIILIYDSFLSSDTTIGSVTGLTLDFINDSA